MPDGRRLNLELPAWLICGRANECTQDKVTCIQNGKGIRPGVFPSTLPHIQHSHTHPTYPLYFRYQGRLVAVVGDNVEPTFCREPRGDPGVFRPPPSGEPGRALGDFCLLCGAIN